MIKLPQLEIKKIDVLSTWKHIKITVRIAGYESEDFNYYITMFRERKTKDTNKILKSEDVHCDTGLYTRHPLQHWIPNSDRRITLPMAEVKKVFAARSAAEIATIISLNVAEHWEELVDEAKHNNLHFSGRFIPEIVPAGVKLQPIE